MDFQCPYCPETRATRSHLVTHVDNVHKAVSVTRRTLDLRNPRTVEDVPVTSPALLDPRPPCIPDHSVGTPCPGCESLSENSGTRVVQCVCGAPIEPLDDDIEYPDWKHMFPMPKCRDAIPAAGMPTKADRARLDTELARTGAGLAEAGREMAEMRAALDAVDERMRKLDAQLTSPATVRRATLNQVWDRLLDAGDLTGAAIVMKMINVVVDDQ